MLRWLILAAVAGAMVSADDTTLIVAAMKHELSLLPLHDGVKTFYTAKIEEIAPCIKPQVESLGTASILELVGNLKPMFSECGSSAAGAKDQENASKEAFDECLHAKMHDALPSSVSELERTVLAKVKTCVLDTLHGHSH